MEAKNKKTLIIFCCITAVFAALIAVFTFFDLQISKAITIIGAGKFYPESALGRFFESFGVVPVYAITAFALSVVFYNAFYRSAKTKKTKALRLTVLCVAAFFIALMFYAMFKKVIKYIAIHQGFDYTLGGVSDGVAYVLLGCISAGALLYFMKDASRSFLNGALVWSLVVIFTAAFSQAAVQGVKLFSCRARYALMNVLDDFSLYTPWYDFTLGRVVTDEMLTLGAGADAFKSFPSGHSAAAAMALTLCLLPWLLKKPCNKVVKVVATVLPIAFTLGTMVSRVVEGAHFCTDVLFGCYAVIAGIYIALAFIPKAASRISPLCDEKRGVISERAEI